MDRCCINLSIPLQIWGSIITKTTDSKRIRERNNNVVNDMVTMDQARVIYKGKVQGVWFRANCQKKAFSLGLGGWVRNLPDGSVESLIQGPREKIEELIEWNRICQPHARVDEISRRWETLEKFEEGFRILR